MSGRTVYRKSRTRGSARLYHADVNCYILTRHDKRDQYVSGKPRRVKSHTEDYASQYWEPCKECCL